jgi:hypothetical protein
MRSRLPEPRRATGPTAGRYRAVRYLAIGLIVASAANAGATTSVPHRGGADLARSTTSITDAAPPASASDSPATQVLSHASDTATITGRFVPLDPVRVLDTRRASDGATRLVAGSPRVLPLAGANGLPAQGVTAVVVNVTVIDAAAPGFVTLWPSGSAMPTASSINAEHAGQTIPNLVTVPLGADGALAIYASTGTHLVVDLQGYYLAADAATAGRLTVVAPQRLLDTRDAASAHPGPLAAGETIDVDIATLAGIPADASAVVLNVTAVSAPAGFLTVFPSDSARPEASNLNIERAGQTIPNQVIARLNGGRASIYSLRGGHVVVDIAGWFTGDSAASSTEGLYVPVAPTRVLDTRVAALSPLQGAKPAAGTTVDVALDALGVPLAQVGAVVFNATITQSSAIGYVTANAAGTARPATSSLNASRAGQTIANEVTAPVSTSGLALYTQSGGHLIVDVTGYFAGTPTAVPAGGGNGGGGGGGGGGVPTGPGTQPGAPPSSGAHAFLYTTAYSTYARWNPCASVTFKVNYAGAPSFARAAVADAVTKVEEATGINLVDLGDTTEGLTGTAPAGVDAVIAFSTTQADGTPFGAGMLGQGGGSYTYTGAGLNARVVNGYVLLNRSFSFQQGYVANGLGQTLLHELGHMVGLAHVNDGSEVMYPYSHAVAGYGPGDREGLWYLGAAQSCLP